MALSKDQVLETEEFTSSIYTVENCRNICSESFALDPIRVKYLESLTSCLAPLVQKKAGDLKKSGFKDQQRQKIRRKGVVPFVKTKSTIDADVTKNLMRNHAPNQPKKITVMQAFYFQIRSQLGIVSVMIIKNNVLLPNRRKKIDKIYICIIINEVFF